MQATLERRPQRGLREASLQAVLQAVDEAVLVIDDEHRLCQANPRVWELLGMEPAETLAEIRTHLTACVADPERYLSLVETGAGDGVELELLRPFRRILRRRVARLPGGWLVTYRDVTRDSEVNRLKTEFVASVSHELRTPMAAIRGFISVVMEDRENLAPDQVHHFLNIALQETDRLSRLIDDLLDIARIESGRYANRPVEFEVAALLREAAATILPEALEADLRFEVEAPASGTIWRGDRDQILQILLNLLSNAVKFTGAGGSVTLRGMCELGNLRVEVADTGCGIAADELPHIFDKFYRCRRSRASYRGTGLGLSIARELAEAHGGRIEVDSTLGAGTTFRVVLPRVQRED